MISLNLKTQHLIVLSWQECQTQKVTKAGLILFKYLKQETLLKNMGLLSSS